MTGIDRISPTVPPGATGAAGLSDARSLAATAIGEVGHRVLAWVGESARSLDTGSRAWTTATGTASSFHPDGGELARRGDVYDLRGLAGSITSQAGGTPTQEGELHRALEDFTRQAVVQVAGLSGAAGDRQISGIRQALGTALHTSSGEGVDGVVTRLQAATATLAEQNGVIHA